MSCFAVFSGNPACDFIAQGFEGKHMPMRSTNKVPMGFWIAMGVIGLLAVMSVVIAIALAAHFLG